jgi:3'-phosphoadenosine 5'-phosphosulfate sulfotransferase (PAPS reductase)/FAD synthetase
MQTLPLFFQESAVSVPIETLIERALATLAALFSQSIPCVVPFSGGKGSSTIANLVLTAAKHAALQGQRPFVVATTSNTLVESPEVERHYARELRKMEAFARANNIRFHAEIVTPNLASTWQVSILSGRALPSWPGGNTNCSVDLKINSQVAYRNRLFRELRSENLPEPVTILGTRLVRPSIEFTR